MANSSFSNHSIPSIIQKPFTTSSYLAHLSTTLLHFSQTKQINKHLMLTHSKVDVLKTKLFLTPKIIEPHTFYQAIKDSNQKKAMIAQYNALIHNKTLLQPLHMEKSLVVYELACSSINQTSQLIATNLTLQQKDFIKHMGQITLKHSAYLLKGFGISFHI